MKIGISSTGKELTDNVSEVFARCPYFIIVEIKSGEIKKFEAIENKIQDTMHGAGVSAAQLLAEENIEAVITKNIGPRAFDVLRQFNIKVFYGSGKISEVLKDFLEGKLEEFSQ